MDKEFIRKKAIKLRKTCKSYARIQRYLKKKYNKDVSRKTIKNWWKRRKGWNFKSISTRPHKLRPAIPESVEHLIVSLRKETLYGSYMLRKVLYDKGFDVSESTIKRVIKRNNLSRGSKLEGKRRSYVRWQRKKPNSLWQLDGKQLDDKSWRLPIIDDCSRYCLGIYFFETMTTENVIFALESSISVYGKPREVLTDNGSEFGGNGKGDNEFDRWCYEKGIKHTRSGVHKPTTLGKVERFHRTVDDELPSCKDDINYFRYRYNHLRPHRSLFAETPAKIYFAFHKLF